MKKILALLPALLQFAVFGQDKATLEGRVTDRTNGLALASVTVSIGPVEGTFTDHDGRYQLKFSPGKHVVSFQLVGYQTVRDTLDVKKGESRTLDVAMSVSTRVLDEVVVSAGRYEQKLSDVTVSMEVLKARQFSSLNITSLDQMMEKTPGIDILDGQPSIRGGSGYSYGVGSRVLALIDDMPMLGGDGGDVKWNYLPVENINQVEVIKGASSVLYGSSALNGVIHMRNRFPGDVPETELTLFGGGYMKPKRTELVWWDKMPLFGGGTLSHMRKIGNLDLMLSANYFNDSGYRDTESEERARGSLNLRYRFKKAPGLAIGMSSSYMHIRASDFLLWVNADSGAYRQNPASYAPYSGDRYNIDPYVEYRTSRGGIHSLKTRHFFVGNVNADTTKGTNSTTNYGEYRYQKNFKNGMVWSSGAAATFSHIVANLYEEHRSTNYAAYSQLDARIGQRIKLSGGVRWEMNQLDGKSYQALPVFRAGANYQPARSTFLRASFGQGYRFPSLAEKFANAELGGLRIIPNHELNPETGWSAEVGVKQGFSLGKFKGYADLALYQTRYSNMIEYIFGMHLPDTILIPSLKYLGFMAENVGNARIRGAEFTLTGEGSLGPVVLRTLAGYTFMQPVDVDKLKLEGLDPDAYILKYRHKHSVKADLEAELRWLTLGANFIYASRMVNVDQIFMDALYGNKFLPGYPDYRRSHDSSYWLMDVRMAVNITSLVRISVILRNAFNAEYIGRPGDIGPPRNITLQVRFKF